MTERKPIIRRNPDGSIDEAIIYDLDHVHIEQMSSGHWWIGLSKGRGPLMHVNLHSRKKIWLTFLDESEITDPDITGKT